MSGSAVPRQAAAPPPPPPPLRPTPVTDTRRRGTSMQAPSSARFNSTKVSSLAGGRKGSGKFSRVSMVPTMSQPGSRFRRRVASMPDARLNLQETSSGSGAALRALAMLRQWRTSAGSSETASIAVSELTSVLHLVERAASVITDSRSVEMVMKYKFLTLPDVYDPELQRYLLSSFTPKQGPAASGAGSGRAVSPLVVTGDSPALSFVPRAVSPITPAAGDTDTTPTRGAAPGSGDPATPGAAVREPSQTLTAALSHINEWEFDVFRVEELCPGEALLAVGFRLFEEHDLLSLFSIPRDDAIGFLRGIGGAYLDNPYHNHIHGADVATALHHFITAGGMSKWMSNLQVFAAIVAALVHDVAHPAVNNAFLVATEHPLALQYNDMSPLENMHISTAFSISRKPGHKLFAGTSQEDYKLVRKSIVQMVLATDNEFHFQYLGKLSQALNVSESSTEDSPGDTLVETPAGQLLVLQIALHAADVSNPAKPWDVYLKWTDRVVQEFFAQGDKERDMGLPVTPMLDRTKAIPLPKFQAGFINAIVLPLYTDLNRVNGVDIPIPVEHLNSNLGCWNDQIASMTASPAPSPAVSSAPATPAAAQEADAAERTPA